MEKMKNIKFDAILPCRVGGTRLYGKPLQFLDIENRITILEYLVKHIKQIKSVDSICLAIAEGKQNYGFAELAEKQGWNYMFGSEEDMLGRIIEAAKKFGTEVALLDSTESPYLYYDRIDELFAKFVEDKLHLSSISELPDGASFAIMDLGSMQKSHKNGTQRNKELITSYIFDNQDDFKVLMVSPESKLRRSDIRITVDYPEDLVFCRYIYRDLKGKDRLIKLEEIIDYWDKNKQLRKPVEEIGVDWGHGRIWK
ncbi:MAG: hypothetical protein ABIH50_00530 [bacterium]